MSIKPIAMILAIFIVGCSQPAHAAWVMFQDEVEIADVECPDDFLPASITVQDDTFFACVPVIGPFDDEDFSDDEDVETKPGPLEGKPQQGPMFN